MSRILVIEGRATIGGGQVVTRDICKALSVGGHDVNVLMPGPDSQLAEYLCEYAQMYYTVDEYSRGTKHLIDYLRFIKNIYRSVLAFRNAIVRFCPSIIYVQHSNAIPIATIMGKLYNVPVVVHVHVVFVDKVVQRMINFFLGFDSVRRIIAVSKYASQQLTNKNRVKCDIVYNHVAVRDAFEGKPNSVANVAIVGDVIEDKGHDILFEAIRYMNNNVRLHVLGRIVDERFCRTLQSKYSDIDAVFAGMVSNVSEYMRKHGIDVVVVASISPFETFSLAMVEAWAMGIPTIATCDYGMKELVYKFLHPHVDKMLFEPGNPTDLANKLNTLLCDANLRACIASDARKVVVEQFGFDEFSKKINKIVSSI